MASGVPEFAGAQAYRAARGTLDTAVHEAAASAFGFTERHLQALWFDSHYRPARLETADGEPVTVLAPGQWNLDAGPDFLDAHLTLGADRRTVRGDVEIHTRAEDWHHHGHQQDPRYRNVVAHVTYWPGRLSVDALPPGAIQLSLKTAIEATPGLHLADIDVTAYPFAAPLPRDGDPSPPLAGLGPGCVGALLEAAGEERLRQKTERMRDQFTRAAPREVLYEGVMAALGYQHNRGAFRRLARLVTRSQLEEAANASPRAAYALLMGVSGLLPATAASDWDSATCHWMRGLWDHWWKLQAHWESRILPRGAWRRAGLRPQNQPARRLAAAPALFISPSPLEDRLLALDPRLAPAWLHAVDDLLTVDDRVAYWPRRLAIGGTPTADVVAILGAPRRASIIANVLLPFVAAMDQDVSALLPSLPREDTNHLLRHAAAALLGPDHNPTIYARGLRQQGLIQLFHDFYLPNRLPDLADAVQRYTASSTLPP